MWKERSTRMFRPCETSTVHLVIKVKEEAAAWATTEIILAQEYSQEKFTVPSMYGTLVTPNVVPHKHILWK